MIKIKNLTPGRGTPAICVPLTGSTEEEITKQAGAAACSDADIVEWRADFCVEVFKEDGIDLKRAGEILAGLRKKLGDKSILFTVRTKKEGGNAYIDEKTYGSTLVSVLEAGRKKNTEDGKAKGTADIIDVEYSAGEKTVGTIIGLAGKTGTATIVSSHDFEKTPDDKALEKKAAAMDAAGADIIKIAAMPENEEDVKRLRLLADKMKKGLVKKPYIVISMGELGKETRFDAEKLGSALTFGALTEKQASAPGQVAVAELKKELMKRHRDREKQKSAARESGR